MNASSVVAIVLLMATSPPCPARTREFGTGRNGARGRLIRQRLGG
jgi:hypothetical protein